MQNKVKVEESFFEYEKNLKFQNPLTNVQLYFVTLSMLWLMFFVPIHTGVNFDAETCSFEEGTSAGTGMFMLQFWLFIFAIDFQAIIVRIYLFKIMNKKHYSHVANKTDEKKEQNIFDHHITGGNLENTKASNESTNMFCKILMFLP